MGLSFWVFALIASAQSPADDLPPLAPPYPEMQPTFWERHGTATLVVALLVIGLVTAVAWLVARPQIQPALPVEAEARKALEKLRGRQEDGNVISEISRVFRRYVMAAFKIPGGELTTAEFHKELAGSKAIDPDLGEALSRFLRECDEAKFSPGASKAPLQAAARALELVNLAEASRTAQPSAAPTNERRI